MNPTSQISRKTIRLFRIAICQGSRLFMVLSCSDSRVPLNCGWGMLSEDASIFLWSRIIPEGLSLVLSMKISRANWSFFEWHNFWCYTNLERFLLTIMLIRHLAKCIWSQDSGVAKFKQDLDHLLMDTAGISGFGNLKFRNSNFTHLGHTFPREKVRSPVNFSQLQVELFNRIGDRT